ncbi:ATP-binding protein [Streptomyces sp. NPDC059688]|uniref:ATP-binding protein n=1 Tax=Streptomyces sp. NPDC059688 TaxID=3346906 RepID=UPI0036BBAA6D
MEGGRFRSLGTANSSEPEQKAPEVIFMYAISHDSLSGQSGSRAADLRPACATAARDRSARRLLAHQPARNDADVVQVLEHRPEAAGAARQTAQSVLENWQVDTGAVEATVLVVSEMVTNAIEHAQPPIALHLHREPSSSRLWVSVTDGGPAQEVGAWTASCADDEHGRGLSIIDTLAEAHGIRTQPTGSTTRWARLNAACQDLRP